MKIICLVGHSERKTGAYNSSLDLKEYILNKDLASRVNTILLNRGIDSTLFYRKNGYKRLPQELNKLNANIIVSFHFNGSSNKSVNGTETLYYKFSKTSDKLARIVQDAMVDYLGYRDRGIKPKIKTDRGGHLLKSTNCSTILVEPCFMSSDVVLDCIDRFDGLAEAIADGLEIYIDTL